MPRVETLNTISNFNFNVFFLRVSKAFSRTIIRIKGGGCWFFMQVSICTNIYSCFEKGCPTKPYATVPKGIFGNEG